MHPGLLVVIFMAGGLALGALLKHINRITQIPYTPMLFLSGLIGGMYSSYLGQLGQAIQLVTQINPFAILMIFLPILIFESGFNADWYIFKKQFGQSFILAFPCVVISAVVIMLSLKIVLAYSDQYYTWSGAFMFGSILSCTDTVAVLALLKEIGAPKKLNSLIQGESLLNDGSSMVLFSLASQIVKGYSTSVIHVICLFFSLTLGGVFLGVIFGIIATFWIKKIFNDQIQVVSVTVVSCYLLFFTAENIEYNGLKISGIISLVSFGLYMAACGKTRIASQAHFAVYGFWKYASFMAQTIIFVLAGILVGTRLFSVVSSISIIDFYKLLLLYLCMMFGRFIAICTFMNILPNIGYGLSWRQVYVLSYGGLRGAIGISFALIVANDQEYDKQLRQIILFDMAGNAVLTLLINGTTTGILVKKLGLTASSLIKDKLLLSFLEYLIKTSKQEQQRIKKYKTDINWLKIQQLIGIPEYQNKIQALKNDIMQKESLENKITHKNTPLQLQLTKIIQKTHLENSSLLLTQNQGPFSESMVAQIRNNFLKSLKSTYWSYLQKNKCSPNAVIILSQSVDWDLDQQTQPMNSFQFVKGHLQFYSIKLLFTLRQLPLIGSYFRNYLFNQVAFAYDIVSSFIEAHQQVQIKSSQLAYGKQIKQLILSQSIIQRKVAQDFLQNYLNASFPQISKAVQTRKSSYSLIQYMKSFIKKYRRAGQLKEEEYFQLKTFIDLSTIKLDNHSPQWKLSSLQQALQNSVLFQSLSKDVLKALCEQITYQAFETNEVVFSDGDKGKYVYLIRRGCGSIFYQNQMGIFKQKIGTMGLIGMQAILQQSRYRTKFTVQSIIYLALIKISSLRKIFSTFTEFQQQFWKIFYNQILPLGYIQKKDFQNIKKYVQFKRIPIDYHISHSQNIILICGEIKEIREHQEISHRAVKIIPEKRGQLIATKQSRILVIQISNMNNLKHLKQLLNRNPNPNVRLSFSQHYRI